MSESKCQSIQNIFRAPGMTLLDWRMLAFDSLRDMLQELREEYNATIEGSEQLIPSP